MQTKGVAPQKLEIRSNFWSVFIMTLTRLSFTFKMKEKNMTSHTSIDKRSF